MFKIGDLVKLDAVYHPERHPPMGTMGIVIHVEDWHEETPADFDGESKLPSLEQFIRVHWACAPNTEDQCYSNTRLKMVKTC